MIIDGHAHISGAYGDTERISETLSSLNIDKVVLLPSDSKKEYLIPKLPISEPIVLLNKMIKLATALTKSTDKIIQGNIDVYSIKKKMPNQVIQFYWLIQNNLENLDRDYALMNFEGIKLHQCWEYFDMESNFIKRVFDWLEVHQLPLFIHFFSYKDIKKFYISVSDYTFPIIVAHLMGFELFSELPPKL